MIDKTKHKTSKEELKLMETINKKVDTITYLVAINAMKGYPFEDRVIKLLLFDFLDMHLPIQDISQRFVLAYPSRLRHDLVQSHQLSASS